MMMRLRRRKLGSTCEFQGPHVVLNGGANAGARAVYGLRVVMTRLRGFSKGESTGIRAGRS